MKSVTAQLRKIALEKLSDLGTPIVSTRIRKIWKDSHPDASGQLCKYVIKTLLADGCVEGIPLDSTKPPRVGNPYVLTITDKGRDELVHGRKSGRIEPRIRSQRYLALLDILETGKGLTIDQIGEVVIPDYNPTDFKRKQYAYSVMNAFRKAVLSKTPHAIIKNGKFYELSTPETAFIGALDKRDKFLPHLTSIQAHITKEIETYKNDPKLAGQLELLVLDLQDKVTKIRRDQLTSGK